MTSASGAKPTPCSRRRLERSVWLSLALLGQITFAGQAALVVRVGVVQVAGGGAAAAAGRRARAFSSCHVPGIPASRRARARPSMCCIDASTSTLGSSRPVIPAFPGVLPERLHMRLPAALLLPLPHRLRVEPVHQPRRRPAQFGMGPGLRQLRSATAASAAIFAHARWDSIRRVPDRNPMIWSSDIEARPSPSSPATAPSTVASNGPGAIVSVRPSPPSPEPSGTSGSGNSTADTTHLAG